MLHQEYIKLKVGDFITNKFTNNNHRIVSVDVYLKQYKYYTIPEVLEYFELYTPIEQTKPMEYIIGNTYAHYGHKVKVKILELSPSSSGYIIRIKTIQDDNNVLKVSDKNSWWINSTLFNTYFKAHKKDLDFNPIPSTSTIEKEIVPMCGCTRASNSVPNVGRVRRKLVTSCDTFGKCGIINQDYFMHSGNTGTGDPSSHYNIAFTRSSCGKFYSVSSNGVNFNNNNLRELAAEALMLADHLDGRVSVIDYPKESKVKVKVKKPKKAKKVTIRRAS